MKARGNQLQAFAQLVLVVGQRVIPKHSHKFAPKTYTPRRAWLLCFAAPAEF